jgi:hypothetical protein
VKLTKIVEATGYSKAYAQVSGAGSGPAPFDVGGARSARGAAMTSSPFDVTETKQLPESEVALMETSHPGTYLADQ